METKTRITNLVNDFFIKSDDRYVLNVKLAIPLETMQEKFTLLTEVIRKWGAKTSVHCGSLNEEMLKKEEFTFHYKTPSTCGGCERAQTVLDKIFGSRSVFNNFPFVIYHGDRQYSCDFIYIKKFAKEGEEATVKYFEEEKERKRQEDIKKEKEKLERKNAANEEKLLKVIGDAKISEANKEALLERMNADGGVQNLKMFDEHLGAFWSERSSWGRSGGIARYSQLYVLYHGKLTMEEWNYRDRYDSRSDRPHLRISDVGKIEVKEAGKKLQVTVELFCGKDNRFAKVELEKVVDTQKAPTLSKEEQAKFTEFFNSEKDRLMGELQKQHEYKPDMFDGNVGQYVPYSMPSVKQTMVKAKYGVGVMVLEEQIDARVSNRQMRYNVYVVRAGDKEAERVTEDHSYESQRSAVISIVSVDAEQVTLVINEKHESFSLKKEK